MAPSPTQGQLSAVRDHQSHHSSAQETACAWIARLDSIPRLWPRPPSRVPQHVWCHVTLGSPVRDSFSDFPSQESDRFEPDLELGLANVCSRSEQCRALAPSYQGAHAAHTAVSGDGSPGHLGGWRPASSAGRSPFLPSCTLVRRESLRPAAFSRTPAGRSTGERVGVGQQHPAPGSLSRERFRGAAAIPLLQSSAR